MSVKDRARQAAGSVALKAAQTAQDKFGGDMTPEMEAIAEQSQNGLTADTRGQTTGASRAVNLVVALVVGGLMAAFLLPIAIDEIANVDTSSWDNGAAALWNIIPVMVVLSVFLFFVGLALARSDM